MGTLYWQLNDAWPVNSWSGVDYYNERKALHYTVREVYKDIVTYLIYNIQMSNFNNNKNYYNLGNYTLLK